MDQFIRASPPGLLQRGGQLYRFELGPVWPYHLFVAFTLHPRSSLAYSVVWFSFVNLLDMLNWNPIPSLWEIIDIWTTSNSYENTFDDSTWVKSHGYLHPIMSGTSRSRSKTKQGKLRAWKSLLYVNIKASFKYKQIPYTFDCQLSFVLSSPPGWLAL